MAARIVPLPFVGDVKTEIVAGRGPDARTPPLKPQQNHTSRKPLARARLRGDFAETAFQRLPQYDIPDQNLTVDGLRQWLPKLDLTEKQYERLIDMPLELSVVHNSHWSLASWLGIVLELQEGTSE